MGCNGCKECDTPCGGSLSIETSVSASLSWTVLASLIASRKGPGELVDPVLVRFGVLGTKRLGPHTATITTAAGGKPLAASVFAPRADIKEFWDLFGFDVRPSDRNSTLEEAPLESGVIAWTLFTFYPDANTGFASISGRSS